MTALLNYSMYFCVVIHKLETFGRTDLNQSVSNQGSSNMTHKIINYLSLGAITSKIYFFSVDSTLN